MCERQNYWNVLKVCLDISTLTVVFKGSHRWNFKLSGPHFHETRIGLVKDTRRRARAKERETEREKEEEGSNS